MKQAKSTMPASIYVSSQAEASTLLLDLERRASESYTRSLDSTASNEHSAQYRADARQFALQIIDLNPEYIAAINLLGRIALDEGFYDSAENYFQQAVNLDSQDAGGWFSLGHIMLARQHYDEAIDYFSKALEFSPGHTRAATSLVFTFARQGRMVQAFNGYRKLMKVHPDDAHIRAKLFEVARHIQADEYQPELERDLIDWLNLDDADHDGLSRLVASLLHHKYKIDDPDAYIDLQDLAKDRLLELSLTRLYFSNAQLERFLILVRKQVLLHCLAGKFQDKALLKLAAGFAMQAAHNEYVLALDEEEKTLVYELGNFLNAALQKETRPNSEDISSTLALYAMYEPPSDLDGSERLVRMAKHRWPVYIQPAVQHCLINPWQDLQTAQCIKAATPIEDPVSLDVKNQYEQSPYPRWLHLGYNTPTHYGRALEAELEGYRAPQFFNMGTIKVLIAGAGTGRHALRVAKYFRNVDVTAVDLSAHSLAYAERMAERHKINNIRFLQADILQLESLNERFHLIECSGVLHHMQNPSAGLAALVRKLEYDGVIKLGLYSERARQPVIQARRKIERLGYRPNRDDIRQFRSHLLSGRLDGDYKALFESNDFYSTSGCRDLLFHIKEHRYSPRQLSALLADHSLEFLGFIVAPKTKADFHRMQPDSLLSDLNAWDAFEAKHPTTFGRMFQFYVRRKLED